MPQQRVNPGDAHVPLRLFDWQRAVAVSTLKPDVKTFALTVGETMKALTGAEVKIQHAEKAALFGVSEDTITRRVKALEVAGYLRMTRKPGPGKRPLYELTGPP